MSMNVKVGVIRRILVDCEIKRVCGNEEWLCSNSGDEIKKLRRSWLAFIIVASAFSAWQFRVRSSANIVDGKRAAAETFLS